VAEIERMHVHGQHSLCAQKNEAVPTQAGAGDRRCTCMSYHVSDSQRFHAMPSAYECSKLIPSVPDGSEMTWNLSYHLHAAARQQDRSDPVGPARSNPARGGLG
jgi:hypothetical protein